MRTYCKNGWIAIAAFLLISICGQAQDPKLAQYFASPININPGLIGKGVNDWRLLSNYRSQWMGDGAKPFTTATVSLEKNLSGNSDKNILALGIMLLSDASNGGLLKSNYIAAGLAYHNALDMEGKHFVGGGLTFNYANRMVDVTKFQFQSQFGSNGFQPTLPSNDGVLIPNRSYADINAGVSYSYHGDRSGFYTGVSYFHAARPKEGVFNNTSFQIDPRLSLQAGYSFQTGDNGSAIAISSIWEKQGGNQTFTSGLLYKLAITESQLGLRSANLGTWYRFGHVIQPYIGLESQHWLLGLSYDILTAKMTGTSLQSFELSFGWQFGKRRMRQNATTNPVFMY